MNLEINNKISIVIPTYNRASFLDLSLEIHIPLAMEHNIPIYVSDNASPDNTEQIARKWMKSYRFLYYFRNKKNIGPEMNMKKILNQPKSSYVWLLGDSSKINKKTLNGVLKQLKKNFDMVLLNDKKRVSDVETQEITNKNHLIATVGWNMSQISTMIYSKKILQNANYKRFIGTNFMPTGIALEYLANSEKISVMWNKELSIESLKIDGIEKISWQNLTFYIWIRCWTNFVLSLPPIYTLESKLQMIQTHNKRANIFSFKNLLSLRSQGFYNLENYNKYKNFFDLAIRKPIFLKFIFIAIVPINFAKIIIKIYRYCKRI